MTFEERIDRLRRLPQASPETALVLCVLASSTNTIAQFATLLEAVMHGTALAQSWAAFGSLRAMRETLDETISGLERRAVKSLPVTSETAQ